MVALGARASRCDPDESALFPLRHPDLIALVALVALALGSMLAAALFSSRSRPRAPAPWSFAAVLPSADAAKGPKTPKPE